MTTSIQIFRDGIADGIDGRLSVGEDCITSVNRTFIQMKCISEFRIIEINSDQTSCPAIQLPLGKEFDRYYLWLIFDGHELVVWLSLHNSLNRNWPVQELLAQFDLADP